MAEASNKKNKEGKAKVSPHAGHRARLRKKLLDSEGVGLADYEILEYLLFAAHPRGDTKPKAKTLEAEFGSLAGVLAASPEQLAKANLSENAVGALKIVHVAARRMAREMVIDKPVLSSWDRLIDWCRIELGQSDTEEFHLLFLDKKNRLIEAEQQNKGTVDHISVYTREVVKRALELNASALIMVHNHPSGDVEPSKADIAMTEAIKQVLQKIGIGLHDHIIIGKTGYSSFRSLGLI